MMSSQKSPLVPIARICEITGYARSSIYRLIEEGTFPKQVKLSARKVGWRKKDLSLWWRDKTGDDLNFDDPSPVSDELEALLS
jgi:prophage regulatory protein